MELDVLKVVHIYGFVFWVSECSTISKFGEEGFIVSQMKLLPPCTIKGVNVTKQGKVIIVL
jgi:hypothetical protein